MPAKEMLYITVVLLACAGTSMSDGPLFKIGMIGLDTSHAPAFTRQINGGTAVHGCKVIAAYAGGSPDISSSIGRVDKFTSEMRDALGVEIVDRIEDLCAKVDGVLLESVDGRPHLAQVKPVFAAGKPVFIDKPVAGNLADAIEIFRLADQHGVPCWSSSSLRFSPGISGMRADARLGDVVGCEAFAPCHLEEHHPDLYWYGVHGVELLFTIMGPGCETVTRVHTADTDVVVGVWKDGRIGSFRGIRHGAKPYGAIVYGTKGVLRSGEYAGYGPLVEQIVQFFKTGKIPVSANETLEIFAFMSAADESKARGGSPVSIRETLAKAKR